MDFLDIDPPVATIEAVLTVDVYDTHNYGNNFDGATNTDATLTFAFTGSDVGVTLNVRGYDIDSETEVAVYLNGDTIGFLSVTDNNAEGFSSFRIAADLVEDGTNSITFVQTGSAASTWGVTDILILEHGGPHELPFSWDPEFTEDGYVTWQVDGDGFYLGRMDLDTGAFLGVVNYIAVPPITWFDTIQAVDFIRTPDGIAAIGMSEQGLVYLSETEGYVLEGTVGMRFTAMPKDEVPSLRFIVFDGTGQYLYDDGTLTRLQIGAGEPFQWLDADEVLLRNDNTDVTTILNVETMEQTVVTDVAYNTGQAAAFTASNGDQYITLQGDGFRDIYINTGEGWTMLQRMISPFHLGEQHWSAEFFEWHGKVFMTGFVADNLAWDADAIVVLYDLARDSWTRISGVQAWKDPEVLLLNDGSLAYYADRSTDQTQQFSTITYERAFLRAIPSEGRFPEGLFSGQPVDMPPPESGGWTTAGPLSLAGGPAVAAGAGHLMSAEPAEPPQPVDRFADVALRHIFEADTFEFLPAPGTWSPAAGHSDLFEGPSGAVVWGPRGDL